MRIRIVGTTAVLMCAGLILGFRFQQGILASVAWLFIPMVFGVVFSAAVNTLALYTSNTIVLEATQVVSALLMFFSTGFVPLDQFPRWIQPAVEHQPVSYAIEAMRGLSLGRAGVDPDGGDAAVVGGHRRGVCNTDGDRVPKGKHAWMISRWCPPMVKESEMFPSSVIRKLTRSEEIFADTHNFVGLRAHFKGRIDVAALSAAFDALLEAHPVLAGRLERGPTGRFEIVVDDLLHLGIQVMELDDPAVQTPPVHLDQSESLVQLRLTVRGEEAVADPLRAPLPGRRPPSV